MEPSSPTSEERDVALHPSNTVDPLLQTSFKVAFKNAQTQMLRRALQFSPRVTAVVENICSLIVLQNLWNVDTVTLQVTIRQEYRKYFHAVSDSAFIPSPAVVNFIMSCVAQHHCRVLEAFESVALPLTLHARLRYVERILHERALATKLCLHLLSSCTKDDGPLGPIALFRSQADSFFIIQTDSAAFSALLKLLLQSIDEYREEAASAFTASPLCSMSFTLLLTLLKKSTRPVSFVEQVVCKVIQHMAAHYQSIFSAQLFAAHFAAYREVKQLEQSSVPQLLSSCYSTKGSSCDGPDLQTGQVWVTHALSTPLHPASFFLEALPKLLDVEAYIIENFSDGYNVLRSIIFGALFVDMNDVESHAPLVTESFLLYRLVKESLTPLIVEYLEQTSADSDSATALANTISKLWSSIAMIELNPQDAGRWRRYFKVGNPPTKYLGRLGWECGTAVLQQVFKDAISKVTEEMAAPPTVEITRHEADTQLVVAKRLVQLERQVHALWKAGVPAADEAFVAAAQDALGTEPGRLTKLLIPLLYRLQLNKEVDVALSQATTFQWIRSIVRLVRSITGKDIFFEELHRLQAHLLIVGRSEVQGTPGSEDTQTQSVMELLTHANAIFSVYSQELRNVEAMLLSYTKVAQFAEQFNEATAAARATSDQSTVKATVVTPLVFHPLVWPKFPILNSSCLPVSVQAQLAAFEEYYMSVHQQRRIVWQRLGYEPAVFSIAYPNGSKRVRSTVDMCLLFSAISDASSGRNWGVSSQELANRTQILLPVVRRTLMPLTRGKMNLLCVKAASPSPESHIAPEPSEPTAEVLEQFYINPAFSSKGKEINLRRSGMFLGNNAADVSVDEQRKTIVISTIAQVMKGKRECSHEELRSVVEKRLASKFALSNRMFKQAVEECLAKSYLRRKGDFRDIYVFVA